MSLYLFKKLLFNRTAYMYEYCEWRALCSTAVCSCRAWRRAS